MNPGLRAKKTDFAALATVAKNTLYQRILTVIDFLILAYVWESGSFCCGDGNISVLQCYLDSPEGYSFQRNHN